MSGIAGLFYRDNRLADPSDLSRMIDTLAHRGPDDAHSWCNGPVGLGHCMLYTTPESLHEQLPFVHSSGELVITADARIDNRAELVSLLNLDPRPVSEPTDSQLILAAYERWGEACTDKLLGAFAFVIWDERKNQLFCARDHFGIKSLYYYLSERAFFFATEIKGILCLSEVPRRLNEIRVADYLAPLAEDKAYTFYQDIFRLPPAYRMCIQPHRVSKTAYWALDPNHEIRLSSNEEYAESFREIFIEVIQSCLRSAFPIGSELSGGLDSSSITCVARNLLAVENCKKLKTFSFTFDEDAPCYEVPYIDHVLAQKGLVPYFARGDQSGPLTNIGAFLDYADEPFHLPNFFQSWDLFRLIQSHGIRVVLDGFDGDSTVSHGWTYLTELAQAGRWRELGIEAEASSSRLRTVSRLSLLKHHAIPILQRRARNGQWFRLLGDTREIAKHFPLSQWRLLYRYGMRPAISESLRRIHYTHEPVGDDMKLISPFLDTDFVRRVGLIERFRELTGARMQPSQTERESHWNTLTTGLFSHVLEKMDSLAAPFNLDLRHPFMDKRLVQFCLALPPEQKRNQGWDRLILRRAMTDILPYEVQWRPDKADFSNNFVDGLLRYDRDRLDTLLLKDDLCVSKYVNIDKLRDFYLQLTTTKKDDEGQSINLWLIVVLELWLRRSGISA